MRRYAALTMSSLIFVAACNFGDGSANGEVGTTIGSELQCPSCSVVVETVATIDSLDFQGPEGTIARDASGRIYLGYQGLLLVYAPDGRFLQQIGRQGGGPGEYEDIRNILFGSNGSIHILDGQLGRHSVFDSGGSFVRSVTLSAALGGGTAALLPDNHMAVNQQPTFPNSVSAIIQVVDAEGTPIRSLEEIVGEEPRELWTFRRLLSTRRSGALLVGHPYAFTLDLYDANRTEKRSFRRVADWSPAGPPKGPPSYGMFDAPFTPQLRTIWEDSDGLVWLHTWIPSESWQPEAPYNPQRPPSQEDYVRLGQRPRLESIVEAIDLEHGQVVARLQVPGALGTPVGEGYYASTVEDAAGIPSVQISHVTLRR